MAHSHDVIDRDPTFVIDADTRSINLQSVFDTSLMQYDHNSERFTFEAPIKIEEHDMSKCDRIEIHYINIGSNSKRNPGVYEIDDLTPGTDTIRFSWLISQNATSLDGTLSFMVRFVCTSDGKYEYVWNTSIYSGISVGTGMNNSDVVVSQYADILGAWYNQLVAAGDAGIAKIEKAAADALTELEQAKDSIIDTIDREEITSAVTAAATEATVANLDKEGIIDALQENVYTKEEVYTKTEVDALQENVYTKEEVYTKTEVDALQENVYTKEEVYTKTEIDAKADALEQTVYTKEEVYSKEELDTILGTYVTDMANLIGGEAIA